MRLPSLSLRGALLAGWGSYGLLCAAISLLQPGARPLPAVALKLWLLVPTIVTTLAVPALARRARIAPGRVARGWILHVAIACVFAAAWSEMRWQLGLFRPPIRPSALRDEVERLLA